MKELLRASERQRNYLNNLHRISIIASGTKQMLKFDPNADPTIEIEDLEFTVDAEEFINILNRAASGFYNELVHPLIEKRDPESRYFRGTDKKMRRLALEAIEEARNAQFVPQKT